MAVAILDRRPTLRRRWLQSVNQEGEQQREHKSTSNIHFLADEELTEIKEKHEKPFQEIDALNSNMTYSYQQDNESGRVQIDKEDEEGTLPPTPNDRNSPLPDNDIGKKYDGEKIKEGETGIHSPTPDDRYSHLPKENNAGENVGINDEEGEQEMHLFDEDKQKLDVSKLKDKSPVTRSYEDRNTGPDKSMIAMAVVLSSILMVLSLLACCFLKKKSKEDNMTEMKGAQKTTEDMVLSGGEIRTVGTGDTISVE